MKGALAELSTAFVKQHPTIRITPTFGASGNFYSQLASKAPFDVFLSADTTYPHKLAQGGLALPGSERVYARGALVIWVPKDSKLDIEGQGLKALTGAKHISMANPKLAPYGRAAEAALEAAGVQDALKERIVLGENVEQTAQFAQTGAAEAGLVPLSLALGPAMKDAGRYVPVPAGLYPPIEHGLIITAWAQNADDARAFCDFIRGPSGREILTRLGLSAPEQ